MLSPSSAVAVLIAAATLLELRPAACAFSPPNSCHSATQATAQSQQRRKHTLLHYIQFGGIDEEEDDDDNKEDDLKRRRQESSSDNERSASSSSAAQVIPIIGPIPNLPPLLITGEMTLSPPTPMQWRALQEAVVVHRNALAREQAEQGGNGRKSSTAAGTATPEDTGGTIDAAPLVAVIDEISGPA